MLVTVFCAPRGRAEITFSLEVSPELELRDFTALCELESGIPAAEIQISYAEQPLQDPTCTLLTYGVKDGDVVVLRQAERRTPPAQPSFPGLPRIDFSSIAVPGTSSSRATTQRPNPPSHPQPAQAPPPPLSASSSSPEALDNPSLLRDMLLANPHELSLLKERNPPLAEALLSGDLERFKTVLQEQQHERSRREQERIRLLTADPFDLEAQAKIEEDIRQHNIEENMTIAMEEAPESFGQVVMLYINCKVNGHPVKAFVDSGAQMTIMSQACAERCNIMRLVDRRWAGIAKGVGTQKIIGRVHLAQVQIEGDFLPCSFSILEDQPMDMLLGLDMLKRHQCSIDLKKSVLLIGTTGSETRFLPEAELPECARLAYGADARPEDIADRELAEALQRSVQESDAEDRQTTSPQSPSHNLPNTIDKTLDFSPSLLNQSQKSALEGSTSVPFSVHNPSPEETPPSGHLELSGSPSTTLESQELADPTIPQPDSFSCAGSEDEALSESVRNADIQESSPALMEVDAAEKDSVLTFLKADDSLDLQQMEQDLAEVGDAKNVEPSVSVEQPGDKGEEMVVEIAPPSQHCSEGFSDSDSCSLPPLRDQPEGERQPSTDSMPSLAAALMELHELLVSSSHSFSCDPTPTLSTVPEREDADGVDKEPAEDLEQISGSTSFTENIAPSPEVPGAHAETPSSSLPMDSSIHEETYERAALIPSVDASVVEERIGGPGSENDPADLSQRQVRQPPEGQQGRGVADGRASGPEFSTPVFFRMRPTSPAQLSPLNPLPNSAHVPTIPNEEDTVASHGEVPATVPSPPSPTSSYQLSPTSLPPPSSQHPRPPDTSSVITTQPIHNTLSVPFHLSASSSFASPQSDDTSLQQPPISTQSSLASPSPLSSEEAFQSPEHSLPFHNTSSPVPTQPPPNYYGSPSLDGCSFSSHQGSRLSEASSSAVPPKPDGEARNNSSHPPCPSTLVSSQSPSLCDPLLPSHPFPPAPQLSPPQFPVGHIQRIQDSGFSTVEAVEALEQAQGNVELALLALLARKITVPT